MQFLCFLARDLLYSLVALTKGLNMKLAITVISESGRISPVFETAEYLLTIHFCRNGQYHIIAENHLPEGEAEKIMFLRNSGVKMLICGAVCNETLASLRNIGLRIVPFVHGKWDSVMAAILSRGNCLPMDYIMPGCGKHHRKCCQYHGGKMK